jgi:HPt (histidine-containing phosphotransfer) domain-containing protein
MRFDLILMDIQMPGMDGVETLRQFRDAQPDRFTFATPLCTPVIAVTANALEGDTARYRSLGFDGYLSKPFRQNQLLAMLNQHVKNLAPAQACEPFLASVPVSEVLDAQALQRLRELDPHGENQLMTRVVNAFEISVKRLMPQLVAALPGLDLAAIRHVAHTLKSSSASMGAIKLSKICAELENLSRLGQTDGVTDLAISLQAEVEIVRTALQKLVDT